MHKYELVWIEIISKYEDFLKEDKIMFEECMLMLFSWIVGEVCFLARYGFWFWNW